MRKPPHIALVRYAKHIGVIWHRGTLGFSEDATTEDLLHNLRTILIAAGASVEIIDARGARTSAPHNHNPNDPQEPNS